ncbi:uncharacterized protein LOC113232101 [Hyposmocoma kahamanoa]|uniref:uncharacterized protein LOC113232101 n=1 Tax=Hyposmocoma kahamanoa TaxID=1477025 RepID=UPI000E6D7D75|nr:uncharacterized protein LOC113232101 [Hyposmocoma kahamanoa]
MWIFFFYFTIQILEYRKVAPDPTTTVLLYDKEKRSSFYLTDKPARTLQNKAPIIKKILAKNKELLPVIIMHLVKSQGADFGIEMLKEDNSEIEEDNGEIIELGDILWFNNVQMKNDDEGISTPTFIEYSGEMKSLGSVAE